MTLLWLQVAAVLYAAGSVAIFPAVLYKNERWRSICVHLAGMGFFFHFVSVVEMLALAHRWMPVGMRETESLLGLLLAALFFLAWWLYDAISLGIFALPVTFFLVFVPSLGLTRYIFRPRARVPVGSLPTLPPCWPHLSRSVSACSRPSSTRARAPHKAKNKGRRRLMVGRARLAASAGHHRSHCPRHAPLRLSLHDDWPRHRRCPGAGDTPRRRILSRSQGDCLLCHVVRLCPAPYLRHRMGYAAARPPISPGPF